MDVKLMLQKRGECHVILVLVTHSSQICTKTCNMCVINQLSSMLPSSGPGWNKYSDF